MASGRAEPRAGSPVPIITPLAARVEEADRLLGLETGADDYLTSRFQPARSSRAVLRRTAGGAPPAVQGCASATSCSIGTPDPPGTIAIDPRQRSSGSSRPSPASRAVLCVRLSRRDPGRRRRVVRSRDRRPREASGASWNRTLATRATSSPSTASATRRRAVTPRLQQGCTGRGHRSGRTADAGAVRRRLAGSLAASCGGWRCSCCSSSQPAPGISTLSGGLERRFQCRWRHDRSPDAGTVFAVVLAAFAR